MYSGVQWPWILLYDWSCLYTNDKNSKVVQHYIGILDTIK